MSTYKLTLRGLYDMFETFNRKYFNNRLDDNMLVIKISKGQGRLGYFHALWRTTGEEVIGISDWYERSEHDVSQTMLHEMIHMWQWQVYKRVNHGKTFKMKAEEINRDGWNISRCTSVAGCSQRREKKVNKRETVMTYLWKDKVRVSWVCETSVERIMKSYKRASSVTALRVHEVDDKFIRSYTDKVKRKGALSGHVLPDEGYKILFNRKKSA